MQQPDEASQPIIGTLSRAAYAHVPIALLADKRRGRMVVYGWLWHFAGVTDTAFPAIDRLAGLCHMKPDDVRATIKWLTAEGWIERIDRPGQTTLFHVRSELPKQAQRGPLPQTGDPPNRGPHPSPKRGTPPLPQTGGANKNQLTRTTEQEVEPPVSPASGGTDRPGAAIVSAVPDPPPAKAKGNRKPAAFSPTAEDIDVRLLPVERQILAFWAGKVAGKKGATTKDAWLCLQAGLLRIQQDPEGGTHVVAEQLDAGIQAGWSSVTYANWQRYGKPARVRYGSQTAAPRGPDAWDAVTEFANWRDSLQQHTPEPVRYAV